MEVNIEKDTVWLNQTQLSELFQRERSVITKHINKIFKEKELPIKSNVQKMHISHSDKPINYFSLDVIISLGYRVRSKRGTQFRVWANKVLKEHLTKGYTVNEQRLSKLQKEVSFLHSGIQIMSRAIEDKAQEKGFEWLNDFSTGLSLLDDYDHENLDLKGLSKSIADYPSKKEYQELVDQMREAFDSDVFGVEKDGGFESATKQIEKGYQNRDFYPSLEEKAAMLLYLIVKNHAFTDGNKRIAAACFLLFLRKNNMLFHKNGTTIISNEALASLTLFIATSKPEEMETVKRLTISILNRNKKNLS